MMRVFRTAPTAFLPQFTAFLPQFTATPPPSTTISRSTIRFAPLSCRSNHSLSPRPVILRSSLHYLVGVTTASPHPCLLPIRDPLLLFPSSPFHCYRHFAISTSHAAGAAGGTVRTIPPNILLICITAAAVGYVMISKLKWDEANFDMYLATVGMFGSGFLYIFGFNVSADALIVHGEMWKDILQTISRFASFTALPSLVSQLGKSGQAQDRAHDSSEEGCKDFKETMKEELAIIKRRLDDLESHLLI